MDAPTACALYDRDAHYFPTHEHLSMYARATCSRDTQPTDGAGPDLCKAPQRIRCAQRGSFRQRPSVLRGNFGPGEGMLQNYLCFRIVTRTTPSVLAARCSALLADLSFYNRHEHVHAIVDCSSARARRRQSPIACSSPCISTQIIEAGRGISNHVGSPDLLSFPPPLLPVHVPTFEGTASMFPKTKSSTFVSDRRATWSGPECPGARSSKG